MQPTSGLNARREAAARAWGESARSVIVTSGLPVPVQGTDQYHEFHAHPEFRYLAGRELPGAVAAFDHAEGWVLFAPVASLEDRVWVGAFDSLDDLATQTGLPVRPIARLSEWLETRRGLPLAILGNHDITHHSAGYALESWKSLELDIDEQQAAMLSERISELRRAKDPAEIALMRGAADATRAGHILAMRTLKPGITERQLQIEVEAEFFRSGAERTAYGSIVGTGNNGAVLHFSPTSRKAGEGEIVLMDAGAEYGGYASDVTRTFPVAQRFEGIQRDLYELVLTVQQEAIAAAAPGVEYLDLHLAACARIAAGLVDLGILKGNPQDLVERDAHALFFPHGLGHMLGLATHDAGGCLSGRTPSDRFGLKWLRADLPLEPGYVVTIEPGIYFIEALLNDRARRATFADCVDWAKVDGLLDFGGIRIEDDVLITAGGSDVLSGSIPKTIPAIEALRAEAFE